METSKKNQPVDSMQNNAFYQNVIMKHPHSRATLTNEITAIEKDQKADEKVKQYLKWILKQTEFNFYLSILPQGQGLLLLKQNLKAVLVIGFNRPHQDLIPFVEGNNFVIEILNIHSLEKGEGYKVMQKVIDLSKQLQSPICLMVETDEQQKYFERHGFKNVDALEKENVRTMIFQ